MEQKRRSFRIRGGAEDLKDDSESDQHAFMTFLFIKFIWDDVAPSPPKQALDKAWGMGRTSLKIIITIRVVAILLLLYWIIGITLSRSLPQEARPLRFIVIYPGSLLLLLNKQRRQGLRYER